MALEYEAGSGGMGLPSAADLFFQVDFHDWSHCGSGAVCLTGGSEHETVMLRQGMRKSR